MSTNKMSIDEIKSYRTPDGGVFATYDEAEGHVLRERFRPGAQRFTEAKGMAKINATRAINTIVDYLVWVAQHDDVVDTDA